MSIRYTNARTHIVSVDGWVDLSVLNPVQSSETYHVGAVLLVALVAIYCAVRGFRWCYKRSTSSNKPEAKAVDSMTHVLDAPSPRILISPRHARDTEGVSWPVPAQHVEQRVHQTAGGNAKGDMRTKRSSGKDAPEENDESQATQATQSSQSSQSTHSTQFESTSSSWSDWGPMRKVNQIVRDFSFSSLKPEEKVEFCAWEAKGVDMTVTRPREVKQEPVNAKTEA